MLLPAFTFFYVILAGMIPTTIASYTMVGEKVEKSLEPLLATPTTDGEILLGKGIAAFIPPIAAILGGATIFMILMDIVTQSKLGYYYFPNWNAAIVLFLMVPLAAIISVECERHRLFEGKRRSGCSTDWSSRDASIRWDVRRRRTQIIQLGMTSNLLIIVRNSPGRSPSSCFTSPGPRSAGKRYSRSGSEL